MEEKQSKEERLQDRRNKLKTLSSIPIIMTLPIGSATAHASSSCLNNQDENTIIDLKEIKKDDESGTLTVKIGGKDVILNNEYDNIYTTHTGESFYLFEQSGTNGQLISQSCWSSLAVSTSTKNISALY